MLTKTIIFDLQANRKPNKNMKIIFDNIGRKKSPTHLAWDDDEKIKSKKDDEINKNKNKIVKTIIIIIIIK